MRADVTKQVDRQQVDAELVDAEQVGVLTAELIAPRGGVIVVQVPAGTDTEGKPQSMRIAQASAEGETWRVRSMVGGHEEIVATTTAAIADLVRDLHEAFPGQPVQVRDLLCESCRRDAGVVRTALAEETFRVCARCVLEDQTQSAVA